MNVLIIEGEQENMQTRILDNSLINNAWPKRTFQENKKIF